MTLINLTFNVKVKRQHEFLSVQIPLYNVTEVGQTTGKVPHIVQSCHIIVSSKQISRGEKKSASRQSFFFAS